MGTMTIVKPLVKNSPVCQCDSRLLLASKVSGRNLGCLAIRLVIYEKNARVIAKPIIATAHISRILAVYFLVAARYGFRPLCTSIASYVDD